MKLTHENRTPFAPTLLPSRSHLPSRGSRSAHQSRSAHHSRSARTTLAVLASCLTFAFVAHADFISVGDSDVSFLAGGPAGLKIEGEGKSLSAAESGGVLKVTAPLTDLKTGISLRDQHLKDALNVKAHPTAVLEVKREDLKLPADGKTVEASASGMMTLNGKKQKQTFNYQASRTGSDFHVQGLSTIDITKFGMEVPCYLGVCVDKDVKIKVKFKLRDK